jgi:hypothetical protein
MHGVGYSNHYILATEIPVCIQFCGKGPTVVAGTIDGNRVITPAIKLVAAPAAVLAGLKEDTVEAGDGAGECLLLGLLGPVWRREFREGKAEYDFAPHVVRGGLVFPQPATERRERWHWRKRSALLLLTADFQPIEH